MRSFAARDLRQINLRHHTLSGCGAGAARLESLRNALSGARWLVCRAPSLPRTDMPKLNIDGTDYEFENGTPLIEACGQVGIEIPRFCYHERLSIAGNCRMCLIEVVGGPP